jgi:hypothetical protein
MKFNDLVLGIQFVIADSGIPDGVYYVYRSNLPVLYPHLPTKPPTNDVKSHQKGDKYHE